MRKDTRTLGVGDDTFPEGEGTREAEEEDGEGALEVNGFDRDDEDGEGEIVVLEAFPGVCLRPNFPFGHFLHSAWPTTS